MLDAFKACITDQTFVDGFNCVGKTGAEYGVAAAGVVASAVMNNLPFVAGAGAVLATAYGIKKKGMPTIESLKGHAATAASYLDPREYSAAARAARAKPKMS